MADERHPEWDVGLEAEVKGNADAQSSVFEMRGALRARAEVPEVMRGSPKGKCVFLSILPHQIPWQQKKEHLS